MSFTALSNRYQEINRFARILCFSISIALGTDHCCHGQAAKRDSAVEPYGGPFAASYANVIIPAVEFNEITVSEFLDRVMALAKEHGALAKGFKGIVLVDPEFRAMRVSLRLKDLPFGELLDLVAQFVHSRVIEHKGYAVLLPVGIPDSSTSTTVVDLSDKVRVGLNLGAEVTVEEIYAALSPFIAIQLQDVRLAADKKHAVVSAHLKEVEILDAIIDLLNRGVLLHRRKN